MSMLPAQVQVKVHNPCGEMTVVYTCDVDEVLAFMVEHGRVSQLDWNASSISDRWYGSGFITLEGPRVEPNPDDKNEVVLMPSKGYKPQPIPPWRRNKDPVDMGAHIYRRTHRGKHFTEKLMRVHKDPQRGQYCYEVRDHVGIYLFHPSDIHDVHAQVMLTKDGLAEHRDLMLTSRCPQVEMRIFFPKEKVCPDCLEVHP